MWALANIYIMWDIGGSESSHDLLKSLMNSQTLALSYVPH
jgi:hypothetical protein